MCGPRVQKTDFQGDMHLPITASCGAGGTGGARLRESIARLLANIIPVELERRQSAQCHPLKIGAPAAGTARPEHLAQA